MKECEHDWLKVESSKTRKTLFGSCEVKCCCYVCGKCGLERGLQIENEKD